MGLHEYLVSREIEKKDYPFYSLVMALVKKADTDNMHKLRVVFPETVREVERRYNAGYGLLKEDLRTRARLKQQGDSSDGIEGNMGKFEHKLIHGTFFLPDGGNRVLMASDPDQLEEIEPEGP